MFKLMQLSGAMLLLQQYQLPIQQESMSITRYGICYLFPKDPLNPVQGVVSFEQENYGSRTRVAAVVRGLRPNSLHALHIHEHGDYTEQGEIYNPFAKRHGAPSDRERKVGSLGNIKSDERGNGYLAYEDTVVQLHGDNTIIGRSICIKAGEDDFGRGGQLGSPVDGNAGNTIAQGVIGIAGSFKNIPPY